MKTDPAQKAARADAADKEMAGLMCDGEATLGHRWVSNYAGVIRAGTKIPYQDGEHVLNSEERALFEQRTHERVPPREIEKELGKPLWAKNVPFFSVYRSECNDPEHADLIQRLYANSRGEIQRLRIAFVSDNWWDIIPHRLMALRRKGTYSSSNSIGGKVIPTRDVDGEPGNREKEGQRFNPQRTTFPGVPEQCVIFNAEKCRVFAVLRFLILGVPGTDLWTLPTRSWYSLRGILEKVGMFKTALARTGQSIIGIPFDLFKSEAEMTPWDNKRGRIRIKQWIIRIDCPELPLADLLVQGFESKIRLRSENTCRPCNTVPEAATPPLRERRSESSNEKPGDEKLSAGVLNQLTPRATDNSGALGSGEEPLKERIPSLESNVNPVRITQSLNELSRLIRKEVEPEGSVPASLIDGFLTLHGKHRIDALSAEEAKSLFEKVIREKARKRSGKITGSAEAQAMVERGSLPGAVAPKRKVRGKISNSAF